MQAVSARVQAQPAVVSAIARRAAVGRLAYVDAVRVVLTVLVIMVHAAITYGSEGDWTYEDPAPAAEITAILLTVFVVTWVAINMIGLFGLKWDPYPFILLNLFFSTQASYAAAKEAIRAISRVAANEWARDGVNVNIISPLALTEGVESYIEANPGIEKKLLAGNPMRRFGDPEADIGRVAVFLASEDASYMTGQTLMVDGGSVMLR